MTPTEHATTITEFIDDDNEARTQAFAIERDAELLGIPAHEHAAHVLSWVESIFEAGDDTDAEAETLLRMQEGAALVVLGVS